MDKNETDMIPFTFRHLWQAVSLAFLTIALSITGDLHAQSAASAITYEQGQELGRGPIIDASWQPDSELFLVNSNQGAQLYSLEFEELADLTNSIFSVFSTDGRNLAIITDGYRTVHIWSVDLKQVQATLAIPLSENEEIHAITWNPDSTLVAVAGDHTVWIWNIATNEITTVFEILTIPSSVERNRHSLAWSPSGLSLAVAGLEAVVIYDIASGNEQLRLDAVGRFPLVTWSPDGNRIVTAISDLSTDYSSQNSIKIWDADTGNMLLVMQAGVVSALTWSPDGEFLATGGIENIGYQVYPIRLWDPITGETTTELSRVHTGIIRSISWNGNKILTASDDNTVRVWDWSIQEIQSSAPLLGYMGGVITLDWNSDGTQIVSGSDDGGVRVWNTLNAEPIQILQSYNPDIWTVTWSPDSTLVAIGDSQNIIRVWDITQNVVVANYAGHGDSIAPNIRRGVATVKWSPDGRLIASGGYDGQVVVQATTPDHTSESRRLSARGGFVSSLSWSQDSQTLLGADGIATLWDVQSGEILRTYSCSRSETHTYISIALLSQDSSLVAGFEEADSSICIWQTNSGELVNVIPNPRDVYKLTWHPSNSLIAIIESGGTQGTRRVRILDVLTDSEYTILEGRSNAESIAWSPDGTRLAVGNTDGNISIWSAQAD